MNATRCFVAIELPPNVVDELSRLIERFRRRVERVRWSRPDQLHITVNFLGELEDRLLPQVCDELGRAAAETQPFRASLRGLGTFPSNKPPRVIWGAVDQGAAEISLLYGRLDDALSTLGIPQETRAYHPHVTLGRVGRGADLHQVAETLEIEQPAIDVEFDVDQVRLMGSFREKGRYIHQPMATVELQGE